MDMQSVNSTDLAAVGYDSDTAILRVEFLKGGCYEYQGISSDVFEGLINAPSKGKYFNQYIKKGGYPCAKV